MGASAHLRWVAIVAAASLAAAVPAGAQEPASPDAAPSGSSAPRPDPAPVKTKPARRRPRRAAACRDGDDDRQAFGARRDRDADARGEQAGAPRDDPPGDLAPPQRRSIAAKPAAHVALPRLPHLTPRAAQRTPDAPPTPAVRASSPSAPCRC